jgi:kynurenine formamidase
MRKEMSLQLTINWRTYQFDIGQPVEISIPLYFNGSQPNFFGVDNAASETLIADSFVGDTCKGGRCNVESYRLIPHCNGTHTECAGHITEERISVPRVLRDCFIPATLITIRPVRASDTSDHYDPPKEDADFLITRNALEEALMEGSPDFLQGLIIRTLPNDASKTSRRYLENPPPFFSLEVMQYISELGVKHLLVDIPSVDHMVDEGKLSAHRIFWNVPPRSRRLTDDVFTDKTITEMIYVPYDISDGLYLANIQIPNFVADAAPSRVFLFPVIF